MTATRQVSYVPRIAGGTAIITGGTSGVGLATARLLAARGLGAVVLVGRDRGRGEQAVASLGGSTQGHFVPADVRDPEQVGRAVADAMRLIGSLDFAVSSTVPTTITLDLLHRLPAGSIEVTVRDFMLPPIHLTRAVLEQMRDRGGGAIVNVASDAAKVPTPGEAVIGAAMAGVVMFTRTAALEARRDGVRVNAVTPSLIAGTPTTDRVMADGFGKTLFTTAERAAALGAPTPEDVAEAIAFLCDERSARTTGQVVSVNGGISVA